MTILHDTLKTIGLAVVLALSSLLAAGLLSSCGEKMELLSSPESVAFSAGDTTYIHLAPDWTTNDGIPLSEPCDIVVGPEGYVFVADKGNNRIAVFDRVGITVQTNWTNRLTNLENLPEWESENAVEAIGQDEKLNLFIVNGGPTVWYWNQYLNTIGVEAVLDHMVVYDTLESDTVEMSFLEWGALNYESPDRYVPLDYVYDYDQVRIDSVLMPAIFYQDPVGLSKYRGVAGGPDETVYVTDLTDRVSRLTVLYKNLVLLKNGNFAYTYAGEFERDVAVYGSGMGTTQDPAGIYVQVQGSQHFIYFTQTGGYFKAQKIREEGVGNFFSAFGPETDFMQLDRFADPMDIWVAQQYLGGNWIFVADTDSNRVQVFNPEGDFLMYAGGRVQVVDSGEVIFTDDFSSGNLDQWTVIGGTGVWEVSDGVMWGHNDAGEISPNTGELTSYVLTTDFLYEGGIGWAADFRYVNYNNFIQLVFAPEDSNRLSVRIYENGQLAAEPYIGTCTDYGDYSTQHYGKFVVDGSYFEVYFGNDPDNLDLLCTETWESFTSGTIKYQVLGSGSEVSSLFDNVTVTTFKDNEVEVFDELDHPEGVAHFEGILYVTDTGNNRIVRYALSSDIENIPGQ